MGERARDWLSRMDGLVETMGKQQERWVQIRRDTVEIMVEESQIAGPLDVVWVLMRDVI